MQWSSAIYLRALAILKAPGFCEAVDAPYAFYPHPAKTDLGADNDDLMRLAMYYLWDYWECDRVPFPARISEVETTLGIKTAKTSRNLGTFFKNMGLVHQTIKPVTPAKPAKPAKPFKVAKKTPSRRVR